MNSNGRCGSSWSTTRPAPPLPALHHDLQLLQLRRDRDTTAGARCTCGATSSSWRVPLRARRRVRVRFGDALDVLQSGVAADRPRLLAHELHAVVVGRIVARRHHDAAVHAFVERREVHALGAAQADVVDVDAGVVQPARRAPRTARARQADVAADDDALRLQELRVGAADAVGDVGVELVRECGRGSRRP